MGYSNAYFTRKCPVCGMSIRTACFDHGSEVCRSCAAKFKAGLDLTRRKTCIRCRRELPITMFNKDATEKDGLAIYCRECIQKVVRPTNSRQLDLAGELPYTVYVAGVGNVEVMLPGIGATLEEQRQRRMMKL